MVRNATSSSPFSNVDELAREISELAGSVNARFVIDQGKVKSLKASVAQGDECASPNEHEFATTGR
jgi:hypothetical protein